MKQNVALKTNKENHSPKFLRKRRMMLVLPLLVIPFLTGAFWALGGGKGNSSEILANQHNGLNLKLPDANLKEDKNADKLSFYKEATADSLKRDELLRNDPYYKDSIAGKQSGRFSTKENVSDYSSYTAGLNSSPYNNSIDANEEKIYQKINELNKQINQPENVTSSNKYSNPSIQSNENKEQFSKEVDRLENMMQMNDKKEADPEMQQLNGTLEKILDIQHPERLREKLKATSLQNKTDVFAVSKEDYKSIVSLMDTARKNRNPVETNGFYGISNEPSDVSTQNAIEAVIHETQTFVNGAVVKMRLLNDVYINGQLIAANNFVYGIASLNNERLEVNINSIRNGHSLYPVKLEVYDLDGLPGIYIPGSISTDAVKQSSNNALQSVALNSLDPSLGAQAATAGIETAKNLLSKKIRLIKVQVKAGYKILLKDNNQQ